MGGEVSRQLAICALLHVCHRWCAPQPSYVSPHLLHTCHMPATNLAKHTHPAPPHMQTSGGDLASVIASLKQRYGLRYIYAWHAMGGFWGGLGLTDPGVEQYGAKLLCPTPTPGILEVRVWGGHSSGKVYAQYTL